jgi:hypothetical protein
MQINQNMKIKNLMLIGFIFTAAFSRLIPHAPNFTSVGAIALLAGSIWGFSALAFLVPVLAMLVTDFILGMHSTMMFVYGAFAITVILGSVLLSKNARGIKLFGITLLTSIIFYLISNFGVWFVGGFYTGDLKGLVECYIMALPFLKNQIMGDLVYTFALFYAYQFTVDFVEKRVYSKL